MMLAHTTTNPKISADAFDILDANQETREIYIASVSDRIADLEAYSKTRAYVLAKSLMDPVIAHLESMLERPIVAWGDTPLEKVNEQRAEIRGELRMWKIMRDSPGLLKKQLEEFTRVSEEIKKEVESKKQAGVGVQ